MSNRSTHIPGQSGGVDTVPAAGVLIVETGLRKIVSATANLAQDSVATAAGVTVEFGDAPEGGNQKLTLKTWAADGATAGSSAAKVAWTANGE